MKRSVNPVPSEVKGMTVFNTDEVDTKKQPMFFGKPLGVQRYDSYKDPTFDRLTTQQLGYFWRPEEVSLQKDRGDYQMLRPEQKHIMILLGMHRNGVMDVCGLRVVEDLHHQNGH